jgi:hypothetical protein
MTLGITQITPILKELYNEQVVEDMVYKKNPFFAMVKKNEEFLGKNYPVPIKIGNVQGRSATFGVAQAGGIATSTIFAEFMVTRVANYSQARIGNEAMLASGGDKGSFVRGLKAEMDSAIDQLARDISIGMYRSGNAEVGRVGSFATNTLTLAQTAEIVNFEVGQRYDVSATLTGALRARGTSNNPLIVTGINRSTGVLTFGFNTADGTNGIPAIAGSDFLFPAGDHVAGQLTKIAGLAAWLPVDGVTATPFFTVNRTIDATRLGGVSVVGTAAATISEALFNASVAIAREGGAPDTCFLNFSNFNALIQSLSSSVVREDVQVGTIGFGSIVIDGPAGKINVIADMNCPPGVAYLLQLDTWELASLGKAVELFKGDSLDMIRVPDSDALELRVNSYANLICTAPGFNGLVTLPL